MSNARSLSRLGALTGSGAPLGFRNVIINGDFRINQRNFNGTWTGLSNGDYGFDRWKRNNSDIDQVVEAGNFIPDAVYTLSGTNVTTTQLTAPSSGNWTITVPNNATNIQLELGTVATPFERRPIGLELSLCHRYFQRFATSGTYTLYTARRGAQNRMDFTVPLFTSLRASPTVSSSGNFTTRGFGIAETFTSPTFQGLGSNGVTLRSPALVDNLDTSQAYLVSQSDGTILSFDAEL
jgi:hypothetical protein